MPYRTMDTLELARFLGLDVRKVERMAQRGEIPCQKVGGKLRFNQAELTEWMQQRMSTMSHNHLADFDAGITAHREADPEELVITPMLRAESINIALAARTRNSILKELVALAEKTELVYDPAELLEALTSREELCSTAMEGGLAIPHPRRPLPYTLGDSVLVIAKTPQGIGYGGPDGKLTDLFFMTCSQDDRHHLHILARLCRLLNDSDLAENIRQAENPQQVIELMKTREAEVLNR